MEGTTGNRGPTRRKVIVTDLDISFVNIFGLVFKFAVAVALLSAAAAAIAAVFFGTVIFSR